MKTYSLFCLAILCLISCKKDSNLAVVGTVKGLKKGTLYLQKIEDTVLVNVDSLVVNGNPDFSFSTTIDEPQVLYLYLDKQDASVYDDRIRFFGEEGEIEIKTHLKNFEGYAKIKGSSNQQILEEFEKINDKFNNQNLDLLKSSFDASKSGDQDLILKYDDSITNLLKRRYLYTGNFAVSYKKKEVAPYLVVTQIPDATVTYLDTLYNSFSPDIKKSLYGKQLHELIQSRKAQ